MEGAGGGEPGRNGGGKSTGGRRTGAGDGIPKGAGAKRNRK